jgi:hypothetical protein
VRDESEMDRWTDLDRGPMERQVTGATHVPDGGIRLRTSV